VTGDTVYGGSGPLRRWLQERRQPYVLAIASNDEVDLPWGRTSYHVSAQGIALHAVTAQYWQRVSAGAGAKGPRLYDWALVRLVPPQQPGFEQALLIRRPLDAPSDPKELVKELAYYLTFAPAGTLLETLVAVAGRRWTIEERFAAAKGEVGLDQYEVRRYPSWYRHITLAMLALAYLAVVRSRLPGHTAPATTDRKGGPPWLSSWRSTTS
jgi:SRSO17 transposase